MTESSSSTYLVTSISGWMAELSLSEDVRHGIANGDAAAQAFVADRFRETIIRERGADPGYISPRTLEIQPRRTRT